jgi:hypothetical protein
MLARMGQLDGYCSCVVVVVVVVAGCRRWVCSSAVVFSFRTSSSSRPHLSLITLFQFHAMLPLRGLPFWITLAPSHLSSA